MHGQQLCDFHSHHNTHQNHSYSMLFDDTNNSWNQSVARKKLGTVVLFWNNITDIID